MPRQKGVRDLLLELHMICMLLLLAEVLALVNIFSKFMQTSTLIYCSVQSKLDRLVVCLNDIKIDLKNFEGINDLTYFGKVIHFLEISHHKTSLGRSMRDRVELEDSNYQQIVQDFPAERILIGLRCHRRFIDAKPNMC